MTKELKSALKKVSKVFMGGQDMSCSASKPGKYDGWRCDDIPIKDWPYNVWCQGCLATKLDELIMMVLR